MTTPTRHRVYRLTLRRVCSMLIILLLNHAVMLGCSKSSKSSSERDVAPSVQLRAAVEAYHLLALLKKGTIHYFYSKHPNPDGKGFFSNRFWVGSVCTSTGNQKGAKEPPKREDFEKGTGFYAMQFSLSQPYFNKYCYEGTAKSFTLSATASVEATDDVMIVVEGRIDENGVPSMSDYKVKSGPTLAEIKANADTLYPIPTVVDRN